LGLKIDDVGNWMAEKIDEMSLACRVLMNDSGG
jgi:hypothetical protein